MGTLRLVKGFKIRMGILIDAFSKEGLGGNSGIEEPTIEYDDTEGIDMVGIGATDNVCEMLKGLDVPLLSSGVIRGVNGVLLSEGSTKQSMFSASWLRPILVSLMRLLAELVKKLNAILPTMISMINHCLKKRNSSRSN